MHTAAERPDLGERGLDSADVWPEHNLHGDVLNQWWGHLGEELPDHQFVLYDADEVVGEGHTGPIWWDGADESLPTGMDAVIERYVGWRRDDGRLLDPWMRVHERLGARTAAPLPESLRMVHPGWTAERRPYFSVPSFSRRATRTARSARWSSAS
jgi:hypothetical protein